MAFKYRQPSGRKNSENINAIFDSISTDQTSKQLQEYYAAEREKFRKIKEASPAGSRFRARDIAERADQCGRGLEFVDSSRRQPDPATSIL